ncbi:TPA: protein kinase [Vibrio alginolyticus]
MNKHSMLFDAAKAYGRILVSEIRVTRKDNVNNLIRSKINRSPIFFFSVLKTRREYQHVKISELVENENFFTEYEKKIMWDGIVESVQSSKTIANSIYPFGAKEVKSLDKDTLGIQPPYKLGEGGFGVVERVQLQNGSFVARKTLLLTDDQNKNSDLKRRFKREVEYQSSFDHSNIVQILQSDLDGHPPSFTMPLATCHLGREENVGLTFDFDTKVKAFLNALDGIEALHKKGHVHRDIKPGNILRFDYPGESYKYAVSDFGLISPSDRSNTTNITSTYGAYGTELYMPREYFLKGFSVADAQSDIYSLGVLLLFLFREEGETLGFPYDERSSEGAFGDIISKCTKREPKERYDSIGHLRTAFNSVVGAL